MKILLFLAAMLTARTLAAQTDTVALNQRARLFVDRGCSECHAIAALKVKAKVDAGPDLTSAYADVPFRYGVTLQQFFDEPMGIMRIVLAGHVHLRRADSDSLVRLFHDLYTEHLARLDSLNRRGRPATYSPRSAEPHRRAAHY
jgi:hypothetical protein